MLIQSEILGLLNDVLHQQGRLRKAGSQLMYHCPFCSDKNLVTQKLEIALDGSKIGSYHCWRCNTKGRTFGSLLKKLNADASYRQRLFQMTGDIRLARSNKIFKNDSAISLPSEFISLTSPKSSPEYKNAMAYLLRRGLNIKDILRYNIGYCEEGDYAYHIIIPSYDANGALNFFIGRRYYNIEGTIPYKKPEVPMDSIIGFESFINWNEPVSLCEGIFDAIAIRNNAVPLFGKFPSQKLREKLILTHSQQVNVVLDDDALSDAIKTYQLFKQKLDGIRIHIVRLPGKDPSKLGFIKTHEIIRNTKEFDDSDLMAYKMTI